MVVREDRLRDEVEFLREENRQLRALLKPQHHCPCEWGLTVREEEVCLLLLARAIVTKAFLYDALYGMGWMQPDPQVLAVFIHKIRRKLAPYQFHIETVWGRGWAVRDWQQWRQKLGLHERDCVR